MKRTWIVFPLIIAAVVVGIFFLKPDKSLQQTTFSTPTNPVPSPFDSPTPIDITARFEIYTLGTKRVFSSSMYHNLSGDVYIGNADPSIVHVKKEGVTWDDFFETLPMKLTKDCLTTGTGQVFCTNETNQLNFFINDKEDPTALDKEIRSGDVLRVVYE